MQPPHHGFPAESSVEPGRALCTAPAFGLQCRLAKGLLHFSGLLEPILPQKVAFWQGIVFSASCCIPAAAASSHYRLGVLVMQQPPAYTHAAPRGGTSSAANGNLYDFNDGLLWGCFRLDDRRGRPTVVVPVGHGQRAGSTCRGRRNDPQDRRRPLAIVNTLAAPTAGRWLSLLRRRLALGASIRFRASPETAPGIANRSAVRGADKWNTRKPHSARPPRTHPPAGSFPR